MICRLIFLEKCSLRNSKKRCQCPGKETCDYLTRHDLFRKEICIAYVVAHSYLACLLLQDCKHVEQIYLWLELIAVLGIAYLVDTSAALPL